MEYIPAAGVMQTKPVIIPCVAPITEGFLKKRMSRSSQVRRLVAAQTWVLSTASDASMLAAYGSPPLNPVHPIHSIPAPASISRILFGGNLSLSFGALGPTYNKDLLDRSMSYQYLLVLRICCYGSVTYPEGSSEASYARGEVNDVAT